MKQIMKQNKKRTVYSDEMDSHKNCQNELCIFIKQIQTSDIKNMIEKICMHLMKYADMEHNIH